VKSALVLTPSSQSDGFFGNNLAALGNAANYEQSNDDLRCLIALLHESWHFRQDFFPGIGLWDHAKRLQSCLTFSMRSKGGILGNIEHTTDSSRDFLLYWARTAPLLQKSEYDEAKEIESFAIEELRLKRDDAVAVSHWDLRFQSRAIATCPSSLGGEFGERIDSVKDAEHRLCRREPSSRP
jgi:hypothetical protein